MLSINNRAEAFSSGDETLVRKIAGVGIINPMCSELRWLHFNQICLARQLTNHNKKSTRKPIYSAYPEATGFLLVEPAGSRVEQEFIRNGFVCPPFHPLHDGTKKLSSDGERFI